MLRERKDTILLVLLVTRDITKRIGVSNGQKITFRS